MSTFTAHYQSPKNSFNRANGLFDFDSDNRLGSKALQHDARLNMLERFGNEALSWTIDRIERKKKSFPVDGQTMLDFRDPPQKRKRKKSKGWW